MTADILEKFIDTNYSLAKKMQDTQHGYMGIYKNPFHLEGTIWTHTMMVMKLAEKYGKIQLLSALLHDIGKTETVLDQTNHRRSFRNHEAVSFLMANDILEFYDISKKDKNRILTVVANHGNFYRFFEHGRIPEHNYEKIQNRFDKETLSDLFDFYGCDHDGRIHSTNRFNVQDELYNDFKKIIETYPSIKPQNLKTPQMTVLVGLPRSGKTTFSKKLKGTIISRDALIEESNGTNYNEKWKNVDQEEIDKKLMQNFQNALRNKENIIIDMTNLSKKTRRKWLQNDYYKVAYVFPTSINTCISRNTDEKSIPENVIQQMARRFYFPNLEEFDKVEIV
jgi:predicted kinase